MSPFLKRKFDATKCKTLLQLTIQRIKVLRNKSSVSISKMRGDIAKLLDSDGHSSASLMVEHLVREMKMNSAYVLIENYCQTTINQLATIKSHKECPMELKEEITSLIYAAEHCTGLHELQKAQKMFASKYGSEFLHAAKDLRSGCVVNEQLIEKLFLQPSPKPEIKLKLLKDIAEEYKLKWNYGPNDTLDTSKINNSHMGPHPSSSEDQAALKADMISAKKKSPVDVNEPEGENTSTVTSDSITYRGRGEKMNYEAKTIEEQDNEENVTDGSQNKRNLEGHLKPENHDFLNETGAVRNRQREGKGIGESKSKSEFVDMETAARVAFLSASEAAEAAKAALIMIGTRSEERMYAKVKLRFQVTGREKETLRDENVNSSSSNSDHAGLMMDDEGEETKKSSCETTDLEQLSLERTCQRDERGDLECYVLNEEDNYKDGLETVRLDLAMLPHFDNLEDASEIPRYDAEHERELEVLRFDEYEDEPEMPNFDKTKGDFKMPQYDKPEDEEHSRMIKFDLHEVGLQFDKHEDESEMPKFDQHADDLETSQYGNHNDSLKALGCIEHKDIPKQPQYDEYVSEDLPFDMEIRENSKEATIKLSSFKKKHDDDQHEDDLEVSPYGNHNDGLKAPGCIEHKDIPKQPQYDEYISEGLPFDTEIRENSKEATVKLSSFKKKQCNYMPPAKLTDFHTSEPVKLPSCEFVSNNQYRDCVGSCRFDGHGDSVSQSTPVSNATSACMISGDDRYTKPLRKLRWISKNTGACDSLDNDDDIGTHKIILSLEGHLESQLARDPEEEKGNPSSLNIGKLNQKSKSLESEDSNSDSISPSFCSSQGYCFTAKTLNPQVSFGRPRHGVSVRSARTAQRRDTPSPDSRVYDSAVGS